MDIGGQDSQFVQNFPGAEQKVVDRNTVTVFLDKTRGIKYAIGSADVIFSDLTYIPEKLRPCTLFAMSSFINVLSPNDAWKILEIITQRMKNGDKLIITNLDIEHFVDRGKYFQDDENASDGIVPFNKKSDGMHYKSVIDSCFKNILVEKYSGLRLQDERRSFMKCNYLGTEGKLLISDVRFTTVLFEMN